MNHKSTFTLIFSIFTFALIVGGGAFGISYLRRGCATEAREMKRLEMHIANLKRETEFWTTQIAQSKDPSALRARAGEKLRAASPDQIIYAYRVKDATGNDRFAASFRPTTGRISSTVQR